jgi:hypothetical protein
MSDQSKILDFQKQMMLRFRGITIHWENASNSYHTLDDFLIHLNVTIQEMRNITFFLQSNKDLYSDFDSWYEKKREIMRADQNLDWLHNARTKVVKQKGLDVASKARVTLLNWEQLDMPELELNPLYSNEEIISFFTQIIQEKFFTDFAQSQWKPLARVKRIWIDSEFSKIELLELLQYWYNFLSDLIYEFFSLLWINGFIVKQISLIELNAKQEFLFDISNGSYLKPSRHTIKREDIPEHIHSESGKTFRAIKKWNTWDDIGDMIYYHLDLNKAILEKQPQLLPTCIFLSKDLVMLNVRFLPFTDRAEKYSGVRELAKEIQSDDRVTAILFIWETWLVDMKNIEEHYKNPSKETSKLEAISLAFLNKEWKVRNIIVPIYRKDWGIQFGKINDQSWQIKDMPEKSGMLMPIAKVWWLI